jgi:histidine kinase
MTFAELARGRLMTRLLLSYLVVIIVGALVLASTAELTVPRSIQRQMHGMGQGMMGWWMDSSAEDATAQDPTVIYQHSVRGAIFLAAGASALVALTVSVLISHRVVSPVRRMMLASRRIAEGHYSERVVITGDVALDERDELGQLALSFNQMASRLERTEAIRRQLLGDVAHELRTPLTSIKGYMEGLIDGVVPAEAETFQKVAAEAERLQRLVRDLQELSRIEAGAYELKREPADAALLAREAASHLQRQFAEKGVTLRLELAEGLPALSVDRDRLQQVLLNLLGNALQYTPAGGSVRLSLAREGGGLRVSVADTGIGIAPEHLSHLFDRFYRVDRSRSRASGGTGIGLTIAKHLVEAHGGRIWAESGGPGQGSTFHFTLPI